MKRKYWTGYIMGCITIIGIIFLGNLFSQLKMVSERAPIIRTVGFYSNEKSFYFGRDDLTEALAECDKFNSYAHNFITNGLNQVNQNDFNSFEMIIHFNGCEVYTSKLKLYRFD